MKLGVRSTRTVEGSQRPARPGLGGSLAGSSVPGRALSTAQETEPSEPAYAASWTAGSGFLTRGLRFVLWGALACGPAALLVSSTQTPPATATSAAAQTPAMAARRAAASEVGTEWVKAWLTTPAADADSIKSLWAGPLRLPARAANAVNPSVMETVAVAPGVWSVTVAVDVTPPDGASQRRYFRVPVSVAGGDGTSRAHPMTLPAEISGPSDMSPPGSGYSVVLAPSSPAGVTAAGFLSGLLAGASDITRWSAPSMTATPVRPAPYRDVQISQLEASADMPGLISGTPVDGASAQLLVTVDLRRSAAAAKPSTAAPSTAAPSSDTSTVTGQYLVTVTARAGRWEVSALDSAPATTNPPRST